MDAVQIILFILVGIVLLYVIVGIFVFSRIVDFSSKMKKRAIALNILFAQKKQVLLEMYGQYLEEGATLDEEVDALFTKLRQMKMDSKKGPGVQEEANFLSSCQKTINRLTQKDKRVLSKPSYIEKAETLTDIDNSYRRIVNLYNSNLAAYEYWRTKIIYTWLFYVMSFRKRERLT